MALHANSEAATLVSSQECDREGFQKKALPGSVLETFPVNFCPYSGTGVYQVHTWYLSGVCH
jgi:hypothetical protein